jgi:hypothetical protein
MKPRHLVLAGAVVVCAVLLFLANKQPADDVVEAAPHASARSTAVPEEPGSGQISAQAGGAGANSAGIVAIAALRARGDLLRSAGADHRDLFGSPLSPLSLPSAAPAHAEVPPLPPTPVAPSVPFTYLGKKAADGTWEVYLARGDDTLIVRERSLIDSTYRVEEIKPPTMKLVYLPLKLVQTLDIGDAD